MLTFAATVSPYGPSGLFQAENLDEASALVHTCFEGMGFQIVARHLPPLEEPVKDPFMPWFGAVLVIRSQEPRYGDNAELRVSIVELGQPSYHDKMRHALELAKQKPMEPPYPSA